jgi:hypothetical protein
MIFPFFFTAASVLLRVFWSEVPIWMRQKAKKMSCRPLTNKVMQFYCAAVSSFASLNVRLSLELRIAHISGSQHPVQSLHKSWAETHRTEVQGLRFCSPPLAVSPRA